MTKLHFVAQHNLLTEAGIATGGQTDCIDVWESLTELPSQVKKGEFIIQNEAFPD